MDKAMYELGEKLRRQVLGSEHVDRSTKNADPFTKPLQEFVTEYCWGYLWGRETLDFRTRSFMNLAMLAALGRPHEIKLHVRGAINNGLTKDEIAEAFLHVGVYAGVPAAIEGFRVASETFKEMGI